MATKSMLKDIEIKNKKLGHNFANALDEAIEKAANITNAEPMKRECLELTGEDINKFFGF